MEKMTIEKSKDILNDIKNLMAGFDCLKLDCTKCHLIKVCEYVIGG